MISIFLSKQLLRINLSQLSINRSFVVLNSYSNQIRLKFSSNNQLVIHCRHLTDNQLKNINPRDEQSVNTNIKIVVKDVEVLRKYQFFKLIIKRANDLIVWYKTTPPERRRNAYYSFIIKYILYNLGAISLLALVYIKINSDQNPITGRDTVYSLEQKLIDSLEDDLLMELFEKYNKSDSFVPSTDDCVKRLDRVVEKIISVNDDIEGIGSINWTPVVVDDQNRCDVLVFKDSHTILVFKKMLDMCETDDELAYVLAHQISHVLLDHKREPMSFVPITQIPLLSFLPKVWIICQKEEIKFDWMQAIDDHLSEILKKWIKNIVSYVPYTDELEEEADRIALQLITRCCYDVRKSRSFSKKFESLSQLSADKTEKQNQINDNYFGKHQINSNKFDYLDKYMNAFISLRNHCDCAPLK